VPGPPIKYHKKKLKRRKASPTKKPKKKKRKKKRNRDRDRAPPQAEVLTAVECPKTATEKAGGTPRHSSPSK
jgi:hypothetical protein